MKQKRKGTVLIVDDEADNISVLFECLEQADFKALIAEDGTSALEIIKRLQPDIILMEVKLPDIDGFELYHSLKESDKTADVPVIFLSALTDTANKLKGFDLGAVDYITKPFLPEEVVIRVEKHLTFHNLQKGLEEQTTELTKTNRELQKEIDERKEAEEAQKKAHNELEIEVEERSAELKKTKEELKKEKTGREQTEEALQKAHDELEMRVEERTAELKKTKEELQKEIDERKEGEDAQKKAHDELKIEIEGRSAELKKTKEELQKKIDQHKEAEEAQKKAHDELEIEVENRTAELKKTKEELDKEKTGHEQAEEALQKAHDELEMRVEERTTELEKINDELRKEIDQRKEVEEALKKTHYVLEMGIEEQSAGLAEAKKELQKEIDERKRTEQSLEKTRDELETAIEEQITELAKANKELSEEIAAHEQTREALQKSRDQLEMRVEERTAELEKINEELHKEIDGLKETEEALQKSRDELEMWVEEQTTGLTKINKELNKEIAEHKQTREALQKSRDQLEMRVEERTAELEKINEELGKEIDELKEAEEALEKSRDELEMWVEEQTTGLAKANRELSKEIAEHKQTREALQKNRDHLEMRVKERTAELTTANEELRKEIAQRKRAEEALQKSEANLKQTQQMAHLGSWEWDLEDDSFLISGEMCRIYGLSESYRSHKVHAFMEATIYPDDLEMVKNSIEAFIAGKGNEKIITYRIIRLDSEIRWILSSPTKIKNVGKDGKPKVLIGTVQDITELKLTEEHIKAALKKKEVFIKKTHHRIKNNFRVISSLLDLQSWFINNMQALEVFKNSQERVRAIALIYEKLYESGDLSKIEIQEYIQNMAAYLYNSYSLQPELVRLKIEIKDVSLDIDTIVPVGLIINELVTNSFKYAFPNNKEGELRIILENSKDNKYDYILIVADNGVALPEDIEFQASDNLFIRLLNTLVNQLHGVLNIDKKDGTTFTIKFKKLKHKKGDDSEKTTQNGENNNQQ